MSADDSRKIQDQALKKTPAALGYRMPAEWAGHEATWLAWPHNEETWPGPKLEEVRQIYVRMLEALLPHEKVHLLVRDEKEEETVRCLLKSNGVNSSNLVVHVVRTQDAWIRDWGPTFLLSRENQKAWCKWIFNAWGRKYESLMADDRIFRVSQDLIPGRCFSYDFVLEGGSIEVNGEGTCLVTNQCLLNPNRNPGRSKDEIEAVLREALGVRQILWLGAGLAGDDTDGHVDDIVRFTDPDTIVSAFEDDSEDINYVALKKNWEILRKSRRPEGQAWNLIRLPMPGKVASKEGRLPASYANFYIANHVLLLPVYGHANDEKAIRILQELFSSREIVPIPCESLVNGFGSIHCVTQQEPA